MSVKRNLSKLSAGTGGAQRGVLADPQAGAQQHFDGDAHEQALVVAGSAQESRGGVAGWLAARQRQACTRCLALPVVRRALVQARPWSGPRAVS
jgi:hypothetical protein